MLTLVLVSTTVSLYPALDPLSAPSPRSLAQLSCQNPKHKAGSTKHYAKFSLVTTCNRRLTWKKGCLRVVCLRIRRQHGRWLCRVSLRVKKRLTFVREVQGEALIKLIPGSNAPLHRTVPPACTKLLADGTSARSCIIAWACG